MRFIVSVLIALQTITVPLAAELSIKNIEKMVNDIHSKRVSKIKHTTKVPSPFIMIKKDENRSIVVKVTEKAIRTNFNLVAIVNQSAFIDGSWKKLGDKMGDFKVTAIEEDHVVLKRKDRTITLYFRKAKEILKEGKE